MLKMRGGGGKKEKRNEENERFVELDVFFKTSHQKNKIQKKEGRKPC